MSLKHTFLNIKHLFVTPKILISLTSRTAKMPRKAYTGPYEDAAFDLYSDELEEFSLAPNERKLVSTGVKMAIPEGYWVKFHERSGLSHKQGLKVSAGVIDSAYTGELKVILVNCSTSTVTVSPQVAICQFTLEKLNFVTLQEVSPAKFISEEIVRARKDKGFGSTDGKS